MHSFQMKRPFSFFWSVSFPSTVLTGTIFLNDCFLFSFHLIWVQRELGFRLVLLSVTQGRAIGQSPWRTCCKSLVGGSSHLGARGQPSQGQRSSSRKQRWREERLGICSLTSCSGIGDKNLYEDHCIERVSI